MGGHLVVARTDTIYGVLARAADEAAVARLYHVKSRSPDKACIVLVVDVGDIPGLSRGQQELYLALHADRPTTVITAAADAFPHAVHNGSTLAFRLVGGELAALIRQTGPLLAPSANPEGLPPATTIDEAEAYFGDRVAVYVDGGPVQGARSSRIVRFVGDETVVVRE